MTRPRLLDSNAIKVIAILAMTADHIAANIISHKNSYNFKNLQ